MMIPQELAALKRLNSEVSDLVNAVKALTKAVDLANRNIVTTFRSWYERPLPPLDQPSEKQENG
jgi:hypothetical protein